MYTYRTLLVNCKTYQPTHRVLLVHRHSEEEKMGTSQRTTDGDELKG